VPNSIQNEKDGIQEELDLGARLVYVSCYWVPYTFFYHSTTWNYGTQAPDLLNTMGVYQIAQFP
jgi:hypothetical protein